METKKLTLENVGMDVEIPIEKGTELIQRDEVENTPFMIITINNESFGVLGKYRITEIYHTKQQCKVELLNITWNRIVQVIQLINEINNENKTKTN